MFSNVIVFCFSEEVVLYLLRSAVCREHTAGLCESSDVRECCTKLVVGKVNDKIFIIRS